MYNVKVIVVKNSEHGCPTLIFYQKLFYNEIDLRLFFYSARNLFANKLNSKIANFIQPKINVSEVLGMSCG